MANLNVGSLPTLVSFAIDGDQRSRVILVAVNRELGIRDVDGAVALDAINAAFCHPARAIPLDKIASA